jgi:predicted DNA binding protein
MSITAQVYIEHDRLALIPTLRQLDDVEMEVIEQGTTSPGTKSFPFLVEYHDHEELKRALDEDPTVEQYELVDWTGGRGIYYIEHTPDTKLISPVVMDVNGFLVHTETRENGWLVRLLLPDREALNGIWEYAREHDITLNIIEVYGNEGAEGASAYGLTDEQLETLITAYRRGYFSEPRETSLDEVADEMGLSSTAISGRLRRGIRNLIAATVAEKEHN